MSKNKKKLNQYDPTPETHINFQELKDGLIKLNNIYKWIEKYYKNEIRIENHNLGIDIRNIDSLNEYKQELIDELTQIDKLLIEDIVYLGNLKKDLEIKSETINKNFHIFCKKSLSAEERFKASNENEILNKEFNDGIVIYENKLREIVPIFTNTDDKIYEVIFASLLKNINIDTIKDVLIQYEKYITGKKTEKECINHGINYTESKYNAPKGLLNFMLHK